MLISKFNIFQKLVEFDQFKDELLIFPQNPENFYFIAETDF